MTLTRTGFASPLSAAGDFRNVTPLVVGDALKRAGTRVFEPTHRFELEAPVTSVGAVSALPAGARAVPEEQSTRGDRCLVRGTIPAAELHGVTRRLPESSRGEGVLVSEFEGYRAFTDHPIPIRARTGPDPYDRDRYMLHTLGRVRGS
ncbi:hypothetical protein ACIBSV_34420 [Embleya sp. NPDC050154]|uniref:hypothetical protein n=1 Tax=Embleya sp. NPDC050154 TaxID=3363988 RepID=UPI003794FF70